MLHFQIFKIIRSFIHLCVSEGVYAHMCAGVCTSVCMWKPEENVRCLLLCLSVCSFKSEALSELELVFFFFFCWAGSQQAPEMPPVSSPPQAGRRCFGYSVCYTRTGT